jgi:hypothetical protein
MAPVCVSDDGAPLSFISQQIQISSEIMDVVMIDSNGFPVAVEVKLSRKAQARREMRVTVKLPANSAPAEIGRAMADLIAATETAISNALTHGPA